MTARTDSVPYRDIHLRGKILNIGFDFLQQSHSVGNQPKHERNSISMSWSNGKSGR